MATLGERVRERRKRAGLTQVRLAERCGAGRTSVIAWESDRAEPERHSVRLAAALGVSVHWLLTGAEASDLVREFGIKQPTDAPGDKAPPPPAESSIRTALEEVLRTGPVERLVARLPRYENPWLPVAGIAAADEDGARVYDAGEAPGQFARTAGDDLRVITARGSSAEEVARNGQQIVIDAAVRNVGPGELCVVYLRDGTLRMKRKHRDIGGQRCYQSVNREYPMFRVAPREVIAEFPVVTVLLKCATIAPVQTVDEGLPT